MATRYMWENGNDVIDVTETDRPYNRIDVTETRPPVVEGTIIDMTRATRAPSNDTLGQFNLYEAKSPRRLHTMPGGERVGFTPTGARNIQAADRRLQGNFGGVRIMDGQYVGTQADGSRVVVDNSPEGFAPIMTQDNRLALSPEAVAQLGRTQLAEELAARAMDARSLQNEGRIDVVRRDMQRVADMGFVPRGTDAIRQQQMRGTLQRGQQDWLERNRPRDMMQRLNTRDQIMAQAEASQMTPQIMVADGVMAGYDPISKKIVTDASGARAIAASKVKDDTIQGMSDDDLNNRLIQLKARQIGELDQMEQFMVQAKMKDGKPTKESEALKQQLQKSKWNPDMQPFLDQYQAEWNRRNGGKAPAQKTGAPASKWALK